MEQNQIIQEITKIYDAYQGNFVSEADAICPEVAGLKLYDSPLVKFGSAEDELFAQFKNPEIVGPWFMEPKEWLEDAKTVVSLFFPFSEEVKESNRKCVDGPSPAWLHGRIEGQAYLVEFIKRLRKWFEENGIDACVPAIDERFRQISDGVTYSSNWSERHAAYVCGLGTFGLSKGLITEKGMAGRFVSIIINQAVEVDERPYKGVYDYCTQCGACVRRCPANAISFEKGKNHRICSDWVNKLGVIHAPRYGCGLCQTNVPCESKAGHDFPIRKELG